MSKIFSGIQPSGNLHLGNYIGAIKQWVELQNDNDCIFCIVDLHAITVAQDPKVLHEKILEVTALYLACGIDPLKAKIFIQSENPNHAELAWILNCITPIGQLERMTQFKDKSLKQAEGTTAGLFDYPVLMAADILLYDTEVVPVGEDQKQHIELTRDLAEKFNSRFGETFVIPEPRIIKETARIMSLQNPSSKMSKSDKDPMGTINILDNEDVVRQKIMRAITDSEPQINKEKLISLDYMPENRGVENLLSIYAGVKGISFQEAVIENDNKRYGEFKKDLADAVVGLLKPIQDRYYELRQNETELYRVLDEGRDETMKRSSIVLQKAKAAVGLGR